MFRLTNQSFYEVPEWDRFGWLRHGFGTSGVTGTPENLATVKQIHSADVLIAVQAGLQGTGDGLISNTAGLLVGVKTADCLPILLVDPENRAFAAVHAGWRGTVAGITVRAVRMMSERFGSDPARMEAAIGPGIGKCCFEVGPEVAREFGAWESDQKTCIDLSKVNREKLEKAGIQTIYESGLCTLCSENFYSYRRDRENAGRMISYVGQAHF